MVSERLSDLLPGDRVQVFNPGPRDTGTVIDGPSSIGRRHVHVEWDDGTTGWPQRALIQRITEVTP
jgi:hypothetical protein